MKTAHTLTINTRVRDRDGFEGTIIEVCEWAQGAYVVRFGNGSHHGDAMRYEGDLTVV